MDQDLRLEIATLFQDKTDLIIKFDDFIKAQRLEARASDKYAPAISLDEHVKLRFADQPAKLAEFNALFIEASKQMIENPGSGKISSIWEEMYGRIATVLAGEEDLMEDFEAFYKQIQDLGAKA
jgi:histone deacetylase complex regulatory component SIN3